MENIAAVMAGCVILAVMVLVSADAILRRGLDSPFTFQLPLTENYLLVALVLLSLAWGFREGGSIRVHLLLDMLPAKLAAPLLRAGLAASSVYMAALAVLSWSTFYEALVNDEVQMGVIDWPVSWSWIWIPLGCGMLSFRLMLDTFKPVDELLRSDHPASKEPSGG